MELNDKKNILSIGLRVWYKKNHPPTPNTLYFRFTIFLSILMIVDIIMYDFLKSNKTSFIIFNGALLFLIFWITYILLTKKK